MPLPSLSALSQPEPDTVTTGDVIDEPVYDKVLASVKKVVPTCNDQRLYEFALHCGDVGASAKTVFRAEEDNKISKAVRAHSTLRQLCALFANLAFEWFDTNRPPAAWRKLGYTPESKVVAFDFAGAIGNPAALGEIHRELTPEELVAIQANRAVHIYRTNQQVGGLQSTAVELTQGRSQPKTQLLLPAPPS
nr:MAG: putative coat protein [Hainan alphaflexi-like virus]